MASEELLKGQRSDLISTTVILLFWVQCLLKTPDFESHLGGVSEQEITLMSPTSPTIFKM